MDASLYETLYRLDQTHWWLRARRKIIFDVLDRTAPGPYVAALDVGCGGNILNTLEIGKRAQYVYGLEISDDAIQFAKKTHPELLIIKGRWPGMSPNKVFNLVALFDVLEHIKDDGEALKKAEEVLEPGGTLILTLPALNALWSEHDEYAHHLRRYTKSRIKQLIKDNTSMRIERLTYFNTFLFPLIFGFRMVKYLLGIRSSSADFFPIPRWLNNLLEYIFGSERFFLRLVSFPIGVSILCIARKPK